MEPAELSDALAVSPEYHTFVAKRDEGAESRLVAMLQRNERMTDIVPIARLADAMLSSDGLLQQKYRLTTVALQQLCSLLAPGLSQTICSLAGLRRIGADGKDELCDISTAIRVFNDLAAFRFARLVGISLIIDRGALRVEGLAGRRYAIFSNWSMYSRLSAFAKQHKKSPASFNEALLHGRRLLLRFHGNRPLFLLRERREEGEPFLGGYQFENTEVGECSLRSTHLLIRQWTDNKAVAPVRDMDRIRHVKGPSFETKLQSLFRTIRLDGGLGAKYHEQIQKLLQKSLGLGGTREDNERRTEQLHKKLVSRKLSRDLATRVLRRTLTHGSYRADQADLDSYPLKSYASRDAYDLFNALTWEAKREPLDERLHAEQLAYQLLSGGFTL